MYYAVADVFQRSSAIDSELRVFRPTYIFTLFFSVDIECVFLTFLSIGNVEKSTSR